MIADAATAPAAANPLPINWFDIFVLAFLLFGYWRGRVNGMSREILPFFQWLAILLVCGLGYETVAPMFASSFGWSKFASNVAGYLALGFLVLIPFVILRRIFREKIGGSDAFKGSEYYLGMIAGTIRFACILLVALALVNARSYTEEELKAAKDYQLSWYSNDIFPDWHSLQTQIFVDSATGSFIKKNLGLLLIETPVAGPPKDKTPPPPPKPKPVIHLGN